MFNVTVIKLKDIIKYPIVFAIIIYLISYFTSYFTNKDMNKDKVKIVDNVKNKFSKYVLYPIQTELGVIEVVNYEKNEEIEDKVELIDENIDNADQEFTTYMLNTALRLQLGAINFIETEKNEPIIESEEKQEEEKSENNLSLANKDATTEIVTKNPIKEAYTDKYNGIKIKNETNYKLTENILNPKGLKINNNDILIFHTHTCESYTQSEGYEYKASGNFRTRDLNYSVAGVGDYLEKYLNKYNFNVIHNKTLHDYPAYSGSYNRSLNTVKTLLKKNDSDIIIDLHRDAIGSNSKYAPTVKIEEDYCAQLMFVIGTNGGGLEHNNWKSNLQFAVKIQEVANKLYPGLFKPIIVRNSRYNQHLGKAACIIEVGATGNTFNQCLNSMKYLSASINEALKK